MRKTIPGILFENNFTLRPFLLFKHLFFGKIILKMLKNNWSLVFKKTP
jgi:hypothetical protein